MSDEQPASYSMDVSDHTVTVTEYAKSGSAVRSTTMHYAYITDVKVSGCMTQILIEAEYTGKNTIAMAAIRIAEIGTLSFLKNLFQWRLDNDIVNQSLQVSIVPEKKVLECNGQELRS